MPPSGGTLPSLFLLRSGLGVALPRVRIRGISGIGGIYPAHPRFRDSYCRFDILRGWSRARPARPPR